jgi:hypothetical protein
MARVATLFRHPLDNDITKVSPMCPEVVVLLWISMLSILVVSINYLWRAVAKNVLNREKRKDQDSVYLDETWRRSMVSWKV